MHEVIKGKIATGYTKRVKKLCKSKLNTWAVSVVRFSAGILDWTIEEPQNLDHKTRKIMNINRYLHNRSNVERLYIPRKQGGQGLISV